MANMANRATPVYYFSHGSPSIIENTSHPAHSQLKQIGQEITRNVRPVAVVVFSAHWQADPNVVEVNVAEDASLIYEFHYPHIGSNALGNKVIEYLRQAGIAANGVRRGLDHGVWACFSVAFNPQTNPLNVPIVQVSMFDNNDPVRHFALGAALSALRREGVLIICSGQAVHNMRDLRLMWQDTRAQAYTLSFDIALKEAVETAPLMRQQALNMLLQRQDIKRAHPSLEHLLPIYIAAGAAGQDQGRRRGTFVEGSLSWAQYRFGEL